MTVKTTFQRIEKKYILSSSQYDFIIEKVKEHFHPDEYGETTICNLYFDTPNYLLMRRSAEKPIFKEKLRLRTYGIPDSESVSYVELKRKYDSVVYKRRIAVPIKSAMDFMCHGKELDEKSQISNEIEYFLDFYEDIAPKYYVSYERNAFFANNDESFRITFDKNLLWRDYDLDLTKGSYGSPMLDEGYYLMEIKVSDTLPLWFARAISEAKIKSTSFSKVGKAYISTLTQRSSQNGKIIADNILY